MTFAKDANTLFGIGLKCNRACRQTNDCVHGPHVPRDDRTSTHHSIMTHPDPRQEKSVGKQIRKAAKNSPAT